METEEKANGEDKSRGNQRRTDDRCSILGERFKGRRWQALIPAIVGIALLALGYYLDAEVIKIIGMILVGIVLVLLC